MATRKRATTSTRRRKATAAAAAPAYFLSLTVENVRCFGSPAQTLDLSDGNDRPAQWTIILGDNGVGKTTVLRSLAGLTPDQTLLLREEKFEYVPPRYTSDLLLRFAWEVFRGSDVQNIAKLSCNFAVGVKLEELAKKAGKFSASMQVIRLPDDLGLGRDLHSIRESGTQRGHMYCCGYGATRAMSHTSLSDNELGDSLSSLFHDDVSLLNAEEWLLRSDYESKVSDKGKERRELVRQALLRMLPEIEEIEVDYGSERVTKRQDGRFEPTVIFKTPYGWVRLQDLSLGYKTLIAWTVDFAARMFDRYPGSQNPLAEPAVCLVDEIDLHLHPTWQRKLIGYLTELFPNTQFIVTAHSPLIVQAAANANIVVLRREGDHVVIDNSVESLKGWSVDQILTSDLYGLVSERPPEYDAMLTERRRLLSKSRLTKKDRARLQELEAEVDKLPVGRTPEDIKAMEIIRRAAARLKEDDDD